MNSERRRFLAFLGRSAATALWAGSGSGLFSACATGARQALSTRDEFELASGLRYQIILSWRDEIAPGVRFGDCNDFIGYHSPGTDPNELLMWVNHEYFLPAFVSNRAKVKGQKREPAEVHQEMLEVGGTLVRLRRERGAWRLVPGTPENRRFDARTPIPFAGGQKILGHAVTRGTLANCSGGVTPWGTVLSCEENYEEFVGERIYENLRPQGVSTASCQYGWESVLSPTEYPPEHFGWVVETDFKTGKARKLTALGRFAHEAALVTKSKDQKCVIYLSDDGQDRCLYKFISHGARDLESGVLYVARLEEGVWLPLRRDAHPLLKKNFKTDLDLMIQARLAGYLVGGTLLDRPEGIAIDPLTQAVYISLTNNVGAGKPHGSILKIEEQGQDPGSLQFAHSTFLAGGPERGFSCPDNLTFDRAGNLWMVNDVSGSAMGKAPYEAFPRNGLYVIPTHGPHAGEPTRLGIAPPDAELTGPVFSVDGKTLFVSVQHPGETTTDPAHPTSRWPDHGSPSLPRSCVVAITGPLLEEIQASS